MQRRKSDRVICNVLPEPSPSEWSAARLVATFLKADVEFIQPRRLLKTPDLSIANQMWEIKAPVGTSSHTIRHQFQRAAQQAQNLIFDARRIKIADEVCLRRVQYEFSHSRGIKRLIYIGKDDVVRELRK